MTWRATSASCPYRSGRGRPGVGERCKALTPRWLFQVESSAGFLSLSLLGFDELLLKPGALSKAFKGRGQFVVHTSLTPHPAPRTTSRPGTGPCTPPRGIEARLRKQPREVRQSKAHSFLSLFIRFWEFWFKKPGGACFQAGGSSLHLHPL